MAGAEIAHSEASRARIIAWLLAAVVVACAIGQTVVIAQFSPLLSKETWVDHQWPLTTAATVGSALMGALIVSRYPRNAVGWLLLIPGLAGISLVAGVYSLWVLEHDGPGSQTAGHVAAWIAVMVSAPMALTALTLIFLIAPDGRISTRGRRALALMAAVGFAFHVVAVLTIPPATMEVGDDAVVPRLAISLEVVGVGLIGLALIGSAGSLVRRRRKASGVLLQQLQWITFSAAFLAAGFAVVLIAGGVTGQASWAAVMPLQLAYFAFPICIAIAVLRYQLWNIDLVINRALLFTMATAVVAVGYVALVVAIGGNAGGFWTSLVATVVVALTFQPLRAGVVRLADRVAYGRRATPYEALAEFSRQIGEGPDPATLLPAVADAGVQAVTAQRVTVRLSVAGGPDLTATRPAGREQVGDPDAVRVPVLDHEEELGALLVAMPPGRVLRESDLRLLQGLAGQASMAFRNVRLAAELAGRVESLRRSTSELEESRRRLIDARDEERSRIEQAIARDVMPHLHPLPRQLERLAKEPGDDAVLMIEEHVAASTTALEQLRNITRGVFPTQLARGGLVPVITSHLSRLPGPCELAIDRSAEGRRFDSRTEITAYFCFTETLRDLKPPVHVSLAASTDVLLLSVSGRPRRALPLSRMRDRVDALAGVLEEHGDGAETVLELRLPVGAGPGR